MMSNPVAWFEIVGSDGSGLRSFYGSLFDLTIAFLADPERHVIGLSRGAIQ